MGLLCTSCWASDHSPLARALALSHVMSWHRTGHGQPPNSDACFSRTRNRPRVPYRSSQATLPFRRRLTPMCLLLVTSHHGTAPHPVGGSASCVITCAPTLCHVASHHLTMSSPGPFWRPSCALGTRPFTSRCDIGPHPVRGSTLWVHLPLVTSRRGTVPCLVGLFWWHLVCMLACAPAPCCIALWHHTMPGWGPLRQQLMALTFPFCLATLSCARTCPRQKHCQRRARKHG